MRESRPERIDKSATSGSIASQTLRAVAVSMSITALTLQIFLGVRPDIVITTGQMWRLGMTISILAPLLIAPFMLHRHKKLLLKLRAAHRQLEDVARHDALTRLLNRRGIEAAAAAIWAQAGAARQQVSALMCDIDRFKSINDAHGHEVGDRALAHVAEVIRRTMQAPGRALGRQGGEEFVVLLPGVDLEAARRLAETLRAACEACPLPLAAQALPITLSIGVAAHEPAPASLPALLALADKGLYLAKQSGRNRVVAMAASGEDLVAPRDNAARTRAAA